MESDEARRACDEYFGLLFCRQVGYPCIVGVDYRMRRISLGIASVKVNSARLREPVWTHTGERDRFR